jgi:hypothetical protein
VRRIAAVAGALALLASGCGGPDAHGVLRDTAAKLGTIRSGTLTFRLMVTPHDVAGAKPFGFELHGPFAVRPGEVPQLDVTYRQVADGNEATGTLETRGDSGTVESGGTRRTLTSLQLMQLRAAVASVRGGGGGTIAIDRWLRDPKAKSDGDDYRVTGGLDAVNATTDLLALAGLSGRGAPKLSSSDRKRLEEAVKDSHFELVTGKKDNLLRDLRMNVDFALDVPKDLKAALGDLVGAKVDFHFAVDHPNGKG